MEQESLSHSSKSAHNNQQCLSAGRAGSSVVITWMDGHCVLALHLLQDLCPSRFKFCANSTNVLLIRLQTELSPCVCVHMQKDCIHTLKILSHTILTFCFYFLTPLYSIGFCRPTKEEHTLQAVPA